MSQHAEVGKAFAGWAEENSGLAVDENFEYTDSTVGNFAAASFAAGAEWEAQREPTEAEIEAAAIANYGCSCSAEGSTLREAWMNASEDHRHYRRIEAKKILLAARKAVAK
ncbi:hypothetical protein [Bifidobacterium psychraerophilum]|uniref:hypothetical protein n=1 Tax=Bifidobacterium psychraerophilum TaxID=218140 RepID=UPI0039E81C2B